MWCYWWQPMGRWRVWRGSTYIRGTRERVGSWRPNNSTIARYSGITSITGIKLTTTTIGVILLFQLIGIGLQSIGPTGVMPTSCHWQRSIKITCGGTWSMELMWSLSYIFGASWDVRWLGTHLMKRQSLGEVVKTDESKARDLGRPWACATSKILWKLACWWE